jgi:hypothetical protein
VVEKTVDLNFVVVVDATFDFEFVVVVVFVEKTFDFEFVVVVVAVVETTFDSVSVVAAAVVDFDLCFVVQLLQDFVVDEIEAEKAGRDQFVFHLIL